MLDSSANKIKMIIMEHIEKREYKRIKRSFTTRIRICRENNEADAQGKWDIVTMKDFSANGMAFNYTKKIPVGTKLEFNIALPFIKEPIYSQGQVLRIEEDQSDRLKTLKIPVLKIAACVTQMDESKKQAIANYLNKF